MSGDRLAHIEVDCPECHCDKCYASGEWCGCGGEQRRCTTCSGTGLVALARLDSGADKEDA